LEDKEMNQWTLREKIGQMIVTGFPTAEITPELKELIETYKVANIILFSYNLNTVEQVRRNCMELHQRIEQSTGYPAFIAIDQEGGVVTRLPKEEACNVPGAMLIGATGHKEYAYQAGVITGTELKALGINMDLAPVLDVNSNPDNPVIGVRSYSSEVHTVEAFGINMMKGLLDAGVTATVKHFPGHGDTAVDSHLGLPVVDKALEELMKNELIPFQTAIRESVPCVMTSHILFPQLEQEKLPATMSKAILTGILREKMGFSGIIITDCLEMGAIQNFYGTAEGAVAAVKAGAQLLCISHTPKLVIEAVQKIEEAVQAGEIPMELIDGAVENILKFKKEYRINFTETDLKQIGSNEHKKAVEEMALAGITKVSEGELPDITNDTIFLGSFAYRSTLANSAADQGLHFAEYMARKLDCSYLDVPINPEQEEINGILKQVKKYPQVVYGLYNGHLNRGQVKLANEICRAGHTVLSVTLRNPYDLALLDREIHKIAAYEYNTVVFDALEKILSKKAEATGTLPVVLQNCE
jgi:beta-N-acetylhexosaminidase